MKKTIVGCTALLVLCVSTQAQNSGAKQKTPVKSKTKTKAIIKPAAVLPLKNLTDSFSYGLGINIAYNFQQQGVTEVNYAILKQAMEDVFKNKSLIFNHDQANMSIEQKLNEYRQKKNAPQKAFLENNAKRQGIVTLPSGLQYEILAKGDSAATISPRFQDTVIAHYAGTLIDGKEFDNSYKRGQPLTIPVANVIRGWIEALQLMHVGDKWKIYVPSELGYGDNGYPPGIPGGATLIFEMELLDIKSATP